MTQLEKKEITHKLTNINNNILIDDNLKKQTEESTEALFLFYMLSGTYFRNSSAKRDYQKKVDYLKSNLIPKVNEWRESIENAQKIVAKDKVEVYGRIITITDFILKEFFGPFTVKENGLQIFEEYKDFGRYKLSETILEADLSFSDIKTVNFGSIGNDIMNSVGNTLSEGSFKELSEKKEWSQSDIKTVKTEVGVAIAGQLISGIGNMIGQNNQAIEAVREADKELNKKLDQITKVINSLSIEENEIEKQKKLFDKSDIILDTCYEKILKPIVTDLNKDVTYLDYKKARKPFDDEQEIIKIDNELLDKKIKLSFWGCLFRNKSQNYLFGWKNRINQTEKLDRYNELTRSLKTSVHNSLKDFKEYEIKKTLEFKEFEKTNRKILKTIPAISMNAKDVIKFAGVLKQIKNNITN